MTKLCVPRFLNFLVKPVVKEMASNIVEEGDRLSIMCTVSRGDPPLYKKWLKDGSDLPHDLGISVTDTQDFSVLHITSVQSVHQGTYTCIAKNSAGQANATTTVNVKSKLKLSTSEIRLLITYTLIGRIFQIYAG